ncbi:MAG: hypothetical protein HY019_20915 [Aquabacterium sp.]|uniref:putative solute-binding protein n=1 Tax=Aquabacterium sp. TaxID=1872578 RepID=UPI0025C67785|nr:putative solute-binding protein [Aquabacterium sp.]MBI3384467.1 hypothetical protein [Aquabacterium sp.]
MKAVLRFAASAACVLATLAQPAYAAQKFCVFDFLGASGDMFNLAKDYAVAMQRYGVDFELRGFNNEALAAEEFRKGNCDAMVATAFRTRQFNSVSASIDSLGSTTILRNGRVDMGATYEVLRKLIQTYAAPSPQVSKLMTQGEYEIGGIAPAGAAYPFVNDRKLSSIEALAGKRISAFDYDKAQAAMIQRIHAVPVSTDISNFHLKFNAGQLDMMAAPTMAYKPLELQKGMGSKGGVTRFPLLIVSYQMVFKRDKFPEGFGEKSREFWMSQFDRVLQIIRTADSTIPPMAWIDIEPEDAVKYTLLLRESRVQLAQQGLYDKRGLKVIKRIRCHVNPADPECATKSEEDWK